MKFKRLWKKCPLLILLAVSALIFALLGLGLRGHIPERREPDGVRTPVLTALFLYLEGERALPEDCGIKSVVMKDGVVTVNFSKEFKQAMEETDGGKQAVRAILFTCSQFPGVKKVEVLVDGEKPALPEDAQSTFINDEQEVVAQYPGVVELD